MAQPPSANPPFTAALLAGGIAGTTVDLSLFPLDTLKTRLQSSAGFFPSGGFRGVYRGIGSAVVGSAPGAAFFFCTYEGVKDILSQARRRRDSVQGGSGGRRSAWASEALEHMAAASLGEVAACAVRVPTEVIKQRAQAGQHGGSSAGALRAILGQYSTVGISGVWRELYRGWGITVMREVPFTVIQFPLWEALKGWGRRRIQAQQPQVQVGAGSSSPVVVEVGAGESALYGSISGAIAAGLTTPLDVLKTRVMLSKERESVFTVLRTLYASQGVRPFFAGIGPRIMWISAGGAIFLGSYQWTVNTLQGNRKDS
ncbi:mitochondrial carrier [Astrocystis sublimbata]|nr:mitochondrial carrier [Astrocystis sublimbata]